MNLLIGGASKNLQDNGNFEQISLPLKTTCFKKLWDGFNLFLLGASFAEFNFTEFCCKKPRGGERRNCVECGVV